MASLFDVVKTANERYEECPILFWAMILTGSIEYAKTNTIHSRLSEPVLQLAFKSLVRPPNVLFVIQAVLVICNWPLPVDLVYKDPTSALAGAAAQLGIQNGLHMYTREQDFIVRNHQGYERPENHYLDAGSRIQDKTVIFRTRVWAYCLMVFQNTSICDGLPPTTLVPCFRRNEVYGEMRHLLPVMMGYRLELHKIQVEAINTIASLASLHTKRVEPTLNAMIISYDDRIRAVVLPSEDRICEFRVPTPPQLL